MVIVTKEYYRLLKQCARERASMKIPIPSEEHVIEVILFMIKHTKGVIKIFVKNFDESVFTHKRVLNDLYSRPFKVYEGELIDIVPGYFAIFGEHSYIYQKSEENGFKGTSNFNNLDIVDGMNVAWDILTSKGEKECK